MGFTNIAQTGTNRQLARRQRAAERLQIQSRPYFQTWNSDAQARLETKLQEFLGLCRKNVFALTNVQPAAVNILAPVHGIMPHKDYQHWLSRFIAEGRAVFLEPVFKK